MEFQCEVNIEHTYDLPALPKLSKKSRDEIPLQGNVAYGSAENIVSESSFANASTTYEDTVLPHNSTGATSSSLYTELLSVRENTDATQSFEEFFFSSSNPKDPFDTIVFPDRGKGALRSCKKPPSDATIALAALVSIFLSASVIVLSVTYQYVSVPTSDHDSVAPNETVSACRCNSTWKDLPTPFSTELMDKVYQLSEDIHDLTTKRYTATIMAQRRAEELLVQVEAVNNAIEQVELIHQTPQEFISGLTLPVKLIVDISTGCKQIRQINSIHSGVITLIPTTYISEEYIIVDFTCAITHGQQTQQGAGTARIRPLTNSSDVFDYLSNSNFQCGCYYSGSGNNVATCEQIITQCPYMRTQSLDAMFTIG